MSHTKQPVFKSHDAHGETLLDALRQVKKAAMKMVLKVTSIGCIITPALGSVEASIESQQWTDNQHKYNTIFSREQP